LFGGSCTFDALRSCEPAYGVTSLNSLLYVLRADYIDVYTTTADYTRLGCLSVPGLDGDECNDLTSSLRYNCLYVAHCANRLIRAVEREQGSQRQWDVGGRPCGVSVTPDDATLLVTFADSRRLLELRLEGGDWLRDVQLSADIERPWHAVKLTCGHYVVTHSRVRGVPGQHRVCRVDSAGGVLSTYGARGGSDAGQLNWPSHVGLMPGEDDEDEFVFVADSNNNGIVLLSSSMQLVEHYVGSLVRPCRLHLERATRRLFVSEFGGRVLVVPLNDCLAPACSSVRLVPKPPRSSA